jgi:hypothetical protein
MLGTTTIVAPKPNLLSAIFFTDIIIRSSMSNHEKFFCKVGHLPTSPNLPPFYSKTRLALFSHDVHLFILIYLSLP